MTDSQETVGPGQLTAVDAVDAHFRVPLAWSLRSILRTKRAVAQRRQYNGRDAPVKQSGPRAVRLVARWRWSERGL
jgi:hypothetical protein